MTEEEYAASVYPRCRRAAKLLAGRWGGDAEDLAQEGAIAALGLYRRQGDAPPMALAGKAAWRQMVDSLRSRLGKGFRRAGKTLSLDYTPPGFRQSDADLFANDGGADERRMEAQLDAAKLLRLATARERTVLTRRAAGDGLAEIGGDLGLHLSRVSQIERQAIGRIRKRVNRA